MRGPYNFCHEPSGQDTSCLAKACHVVQRRLGHKKIEMTLNLYTPHVLPSVPGRPSSE